jgi:hypothetical protein
MTTEIGEQCFMIWGNSLPIVCEGQAHNQTRQRAIVLPAIFQLSTIFLMSGKWVVPSKEQISHRYLHHAHDRGSSWQDGSCDTTTSSCREGKPSGLPKTEALGASFSHF